MDEIIFELKDVYYSYLSKFPALRGISMQIRKGEKVAVIGANGTGKSTLLQMLDGLIFPQRGSVKAFGSELTENLLYDETASAKFRKKIGFVFQNPEVQLFCPTVKEDILFGPLQLGMPEDETEKRFGELIEWLNIQELIDRAPHQLSVGEKRKVAIASTLAIDPDVLILDEPSAGLDPETSTHIIEAINRFHRQGKTVISSTHDLHILADIADTVYVFGANKAIVKSGSAKEVLSDLRMLQENNLMHRHSHSHGPVWHNHPHPHVT